MPRWWSGVAGWHPRDSPYRSTGAKAPRGRRSPRLAKQALSPNRPSLAAEGRGAKGAPGSQGSESSVTEVDQLPLQFRGRSRPELCLTWL
jgi:hypothetical protein